MAKLFGRATITQNVTVYPGGTAFVSDEIVGTGEPQTVPHGLPFAPVNVVVAPSNLPGGSPWDYDIVSINDSVLTLVATLGVSYRIFAWTSNSADSMPKVYLRTAPAVLHSIFVDPNTGNDQNSGADGAPLATLDEALSRIPNDVGLDRWVVCVTGTVTATNGLPEVRGTPRSSLTWVDVGNEFGVPVFREDVVLPPVVILARPATVLENIDSSLGTWSVRPGAQYGYSNGVVDPETGIGTVASGLRTWEVPVASLSAPTFPVGGSAALFVAGSQSVSVVWGACHTTSSSWLLHTCLRNPSTPPEFFDNDAPSSSIADDEEFDLLTTGAVVNLPSMNGRASIPDGYGFYGVRLPANPMQQYGQCVMMLCHSNIIMPTEGANLYAFASRIQSVDASGRVILMACWVHDLTAESYGERLISSGASFVLRDCFVDYDIFSVGGNFTPGTWDVLNSSIKSVNIDKAAGAIGQFGLCDFYEGYILTPGSGLTFYGCSWWGATSHLHVGDGGYLHIIHKPGTYTLPNEIRISDKAATGTHLLTMTGADVEAVVVARGVASYINARGTRLMVRDTDAVGSLDDAQELTNIPLGRATTLVLEDPTGARWRIGVTDTGVLNTTLIS
jgi:hypothetical protein